MHTGTGRHMKAPYILHVCTHINTGTRVFTQGHMHVTEPHRCNMHTGLCAQMYCMYPDSQDMLVNDVGQTKLSAGGGGLSEVPRGAHIFAAQEGS